MKLFIFFTACMSAFDDNEDSKDKTFPNAMFRNLQKKKHVCHFPLFRQQCCNVAQVTFQPNINCMNFFSNDNINE